jgi:ATP-dependent Clp protease protease subunit
MRVKNKKYRYDKNYSKQYNYNKKNLSDISLFEERIIFLNKEIDDECARETIEKLLKLDIHNHRDITMYINSPGGSVSAGLAIYDTMNMIKSDVSTICIGRTASMASVLLVNGAKGKRYILPNAEVMIHEVSGYSMGKLTEMQDKLKHSKSLNFKLWKILSNKTNKSMSEIKKDITRKDSWLNAKEALKYGFVDKILQ